MCVQMSVSKALLAAYHVSLQERECSVLSVQMVTILILQQNNVLHVAVNFQTLSFVLTIALCNVLTTLMLPLQADITSSIANV